MVSAGGREGLEEGVDVGHDARVELVVAGEEVGAQGVATHGLATARGEVEVLALIGLEVGLDPGLAGLCLGILLVEVLTEPELEVEEAPEDHRVHVVGALDPALEGLEDGALVDIGTGREGLAEEDAVEVVLEAHEPFVLGRREADLVATPIDLLGEQTARGVAQDALVPAVLDDRLVGEAEDELHDLLVEEGHATLEAEAHRVLVLVAQQARQAVVEEVLDEALLEVMVLDVEGLAAVCRNETRVHHRGDGDVLLALELGLEPEPAETVENVEALAQLLRHRLVAALAELTQIDHVIGDVAGHHLVGALAVQQHGHVLGRLAHDLELRIGTRGDERLLLGADEVEQVDLELVRGGQDLVRGDVSLADVEDRVDVLLLVVDRVGEDGTEGVLLLADRLGRLVASVDELVDDDGDGRGVEPAGE